MSSEEPQSCLRGALEPWRGLGGALEVPLEAPQRCLRGALGGSGLTLGLPWAYLGGALEVPQRYLRGLIGASEVPWRCLRGTLEDPARSPVPLEVSQESLLGALEGPWRCLRGLICSLELP